MPLRSIRGQVLAFRPASLNLELMVIGLQRASVVSARVRCAGILLATLPAQIATTVIIQSTWGGIGLGDGWGVGNGWGVESGWG